MTDSQILTLADGSELEAFFSADDQGRFTVDLSLHVSDTLRYSGTSLTVHD